MQLDWSKVFNACYLIACVWSALAGFAVIIWAYAKASLRAEQESHGARTWDEFGEDGKWN